MSGGDGHTVDVFIDVLSVLSDFCYNLKSTLDVMLPAECLYESYHEGRVASALQPSGGGSVPNPSGQFITS